MEALMHVLNDSAAVAGGELRPEHIKVGRLLWYSGYTSMYSWDCPAIITHVNSKEEVFQVRSLDDMKEQSQLYRFQATEHSPLSRRGMRLSSASEVRGFLREQRSALKQQVALDKKRYDRSRKDLEHFEKVFASLPLDS